MEYLTGAIMIGCYILGAMSYAAVEKKFLGSREKREESTETVLCELPAENPEERIPMEKQLEALIEYEGPGGLKV